MFTARMTTYQQVFYIGFNAKNTVPRAFLNDVLAGTVPLMWLHTGFAEFSATDNLTARFGFSVSRLDSTGVFTVIEHGADRFTKDEPIINLVTIADRARAHVIATAYAPKTGRRIPYIVGSGNFLYCADSPFSLDRNVRPLHPVRGHAARYPRRRARIIHIPH